MTDVERATAYLRHLAKLVEEATVIEPQNGTNLAVVAVPVDVNALRQAADLLEMSIFEIDDRGERDGYTD
jgi:hypothetical protein